MASIAAYSRSLVSALVFTSALVDTTSLGAADAKPNILWITVEDISPFLGAYGNREVKTPHLDQLAKEGVRFTHAYTTAGVCAPSRAAIITGVWQTALGAQHMRTQGVPKLPDLPSYSVVVPPYAHAFPEHLRKAGYYTSNNQKTDYQFVAPVTVWDEIGPAASYRNRRSGQPFFSVFNFGVTHESQIALRKDPLRVDPDKVTVPPIYPDTPVIRRDIARMFTNIEIMDGQVGELLAMLKADGLYDDTYIFFFSDHGGCLPWMKRELLERGTHIPLIVRFPHGLHAGETNDELVSGVDFAPTVLLLAGIPLKGHALFGEPIIGKREGQQPRKYVFAARDRMDSEYDRVRAVRDKRYRYIYNYMPEKTRYQNIQYRLMLPSMQEILKLRDEGKLNPDQAAWFQPKPVEELYDVEQDPWELHNLAGDPKCQDKLVELKGALNEWMFDYNDMGNVAEKDTLRKMWNGGTVPPATAPPQIVPADGGVRITCSTTGASIGYRITRTGEMVPEVMHTVRSWDGESTAGKVKNGDKRPAPPTWSVYDGEVIPLKKGDVLHVNVMRIGYKAASMEYVDGKTVRSAVE